MCRSKAEGGKRCGAGSVDVTPAERAERIARVKAFAAAQNEMDDEHREAVRGQDPPCACDVCT